MLILKTEKADQILKRIKRDSDFLKTYRVMLSHDVHSPFFEI